MEANSAPSAFSQLAERECKDSLGRFICGCLAVINIINYYWSTPWPDFPLTSSWHQHFTTDASHIQVWKAATIHPDTNTWLTAYCSGVTLSTSNTTASKLFFRSEEPFSLRDSELLLFCRTNSSILNRDRKAEVSDAGDELCKVENRSKSPNMVK